MEKFIFIPAKKFVVDYLTGDYRNEFNVLYIETLLKDTENEMKTFAVIRDEMTYVMKHTGQVASIEDLLNTLIDVLGKPIKIGNGVVQPTYYLATDNIVEPNVVAEYGLNGNFVEYNPFEVWLADDTTEDISEELTFWLDDETDLTYKIDFIVYVDAVDVINLDKKKLIDYYINYYKSPASRYKIVAY